jgi:hypothetical protein
VNENAPENPPLLEIIVRIVEFHFRECAACAFSGNQQSKQV